MRESVAGPQNCCWYDPEQVLDGDCLGICSIRTRRASPDPVLALSDSGAPTGYKSSNCGRKFRRSVLKSLSRLDLCETGRVVLNFDVAARFSSDMLDLRCRVPSTQTTLSEEFKADLKDSKTDAVHARGNVVGYCGARRSGSVEAKGKQTGANSGSRQRKC